MPTTVQDGTNSAENPLRLVPPQLLPHIWESVVECMEAHPNGLLNGFHTIPELEVLLFNNMLDLWVWMDAEQEVKCVVLCRIEKFSDFSIYRIVWTGGKVKPILAEGLDQLQTYAEDVAQVTYMALDGRLGWLRRLEPFGFRLVRYEMWKPVGRSH